MSRTRTRATWVPRAYAGVQAALGSRAHRCRCTRGCDRKCHPATSIDDGNDSIKRAAKDASTPSSTPEFVAGTISKPSAIAISGTTLLEWARLPPDSSSPGELMYLPINPAGAPKSSGISFLGASVNEMTVAGGKIYFSYSALGSAAIMWAFPSGGAATVLCGTGTPCTTQDPIGIASDATNIYFTDI